VEEYRIRQARPEDCHELARIWTDGQRLMGIAVGAGDYAPAFRDKLSHQDEIFQVWAAEAPDGAILGWQSLSPYINHPSLKPYFAESSTYVCPTTRARGLGRGLLLHALVHAEATPIRYITANVLANNERIMRICDDVGFVRVGLFPAPIKPAVIPDLLFIVYPVPEPAVALQSKRDTLVRLLWRRKAALRPEQEELAA
jgi:L-amino acid N-acyltransferase YncA